MASSIIHLAVCNEVNKVLNRNKRDILIGSIAPDISKIVGETKLKSHFLDGTGNQEPLMDKFIEKYRNNLADDFVMGYYIHLYTDYLWFKYFISEISTTSMIETLDGNKIYCSSDEFVKYIYNDYTNMNVLLIDKYDLDLKIFYNESPNFEDIIEEIPMNKLQLLLDEAGLIIANSTVNKDYVFNIEQVVKFIELSTKLILSNLNELKVI